MKSTCYIALVGLALGSVRAQVVLFDNTASAVTGSEVFGRQSLNYRSEVAQSFTTSPDARPETTYSLSIALAPTQNIFGRFVSLFPNNGDLWDEVNPAMAFTAPVTVGSYAVYTGNFSLLPNTTYWVHVFNYGDVGWSLTDSPVYTGVATAGPWARQENVFATGPWVSHNESQLLMRLVAVPEPIHASLLASAVVGGFVLFRFWRGFPG